MGSATAHTDLYAVLGVASDADASEITQAYRRLARAHHPDLHPDDPDAEERFRTISAAYEVLGDADKRAEYDQFRAMLGSSTGTRAGTAPGWSEVRFSSDLSDLFGDLFGGRAGAGRGFDVGATIQISLREAVAGTVVTVRTADGDEIEVNLPPGIDHGDRLRIGGGGLGAPGGGPPGDLVLTVVVAPDPVFTRDGADLHVDISVDYPTLVLGGEARVPTLDGTTARIRIPAGTRPGRTFRLRGRGAPGPRGRGDLLATVTVDVPSTITDEQRAAVEALRDAFTTSGRG